MRVKSTITFNYGSNQRKSVVGLLQKHGVRLDEIDCIDFTKYMSISLSRRDIEIAAVTEMLSALGIVATVQVERTFSPRDLVKCEWLLVTPSRAILSEHGFGAEVAYTGTGCSECGSGMMQMGNLRVRDDIDAKGSPVVILDATFVLLHDSVVKIVKEVVGKDAARCLRQVQSRGGERASWWQVCAEAVMPPCQSDLSALKIERQCPYCCRNGYFLPTTRIGNGLHYQHKVSLGGAGWATTWECIGHGDRSGPVVVPPLGLTLVHAEIAAAMWKRNVSGFRCEPITFAGCPAEYLPQVG